MSEKSYLDSVLSVMQEDEVGTQGLGKNADLDLFVLRLTAGGLLAGHGAQKLFGSFGGHRTQGTAGFLESLGLKPGKQWAALAGVCE